MLDFKLEIGYKLLGYFNRGRKIVQLPQHGKHYYRLAGVLNWFSETTAFLVVPYNGCFYLFRRDSQEWVHMARGLQGEEECAALEIRHEVFSEKMHKLRIRKKENAHIEVEDIFEELCSHVEARPQTFRGFCEKPGKWACSRKLLSEVVPADKLT